MDIYLDVVSIKVPGINRKLYKTFPKNINQSGGILIHPFAGWKAKEWNLWKFIKLAEILNKKYKVCLIALDTTYSVDFIRELRDKQIELVRTESLSDLIGIIKKCSAFVGNDSGPLNIATLLGKPTFAIYGPTNPDYHLPLGNHHDYLRKEIRCVPVNNDKYCFTNGGRNCPSNECIEQLSITEILNKLEFFLLKIGINRK
jgi:3-deoxy-D-manno-octulosonic-acid transferase/heptosyltransferase-1